MLNSEGEAYNGKYIAVGYIPSGSTGVNGSIDITAFIDTNKVAISDTYDGTESDLMGTTNDWVMGREVFTTTEWNSFDSVNPLSFKVKVEANEGIWVEEEKFLTMKNFRTDSNWTAIKTNITSIEFHKDGVAPANYVTSFDVTDATSDPTKGNITLYTVDDGLGNNSYKAIVVANDIIYAPEDSSDLFNGMTNLVIFNSENLRVNNVRSMTQMFKNCTNLKEISSLYQWNTLNVTSLAAVFDGCRNLSNIHALSSWSVNSVQYMNGMFNLCISLIDISALRNWDVSNVMYMHVMFSGCVNLINVNALANWNVENVINFKQMFYVVPSLEDASGINNWNINSTANFTLMFGGTTPVHPEFTKVQGTWSNGTFTPNV